MNLCRDCAHAVQDMATGAVNSHSPCRREWVSPMNGETASGLNCGAARGREWACGAMARGFAEKQKLSPCPDCGIPGKSYFGFPCAWCKDPDWKRFVRKPNPPQRKIPPVGDGYKLVNIDDVVRAGDEIYEQGEWHPIYPDWIGQVLYDQRTVRRKKEAAPKPRRMQACKTAPHVAHRKPNICTDCHHYVEHDEVDGCGKIGVCPHLKPICQPVADPLPKCKLCGGKPTIRNENVWCPNTKCSARQFASMAIDCLTVAEWRKLMGRE